MRPPNSSNDLCLLFCLILLLLCAKACFCDVTCIRQRVVDRLLSPAVGPQQQLHTEEGGGEGREMYTNNVCGTIIHMCIVVHYTHSYVDQRTKEVTFTLSQSYKPLTFLVTATIFFSISRDAPDSRLAGYLVIEKAGNPAGYPAKCAVRLL